MKNKFDTKIDLKKAESQIEILENVIGKSVSDERIERYRLKDDLESSDPGTRLKAVIRIATNGEDAPENLSEEELQEYLEDVLASLIAAGYVRNRIENKVEVQLREKQEKYIDEMRLSVIRKEKGPENSKTLKRYSDLVKLDKIHLSKNIIQRLRPESFSEIVGQERAVRSLLSKISSPYPQHIILYGPPGVGKTTAARLALEEAKRKSFTPYKASAKFVEVDGTTLRWDPREIANPLLGSVHDPIYQGSKRDLAESGIPEPKPGLVTEAHGGILFIDEIGEMDSILQNKLLKVLEDKRVEFSSSYYDPDDTGTPQYIKYLFEKGAPADFTLIGATTKDPSEISEALKSRCTAVYFEPLIPSDIVKIVISAAERLGAKMEEGIPEYISSHTAEGRKAVNILSDAYSLSVYNSGNAEDVRITLEDVREITGAQRTVPLEMLEDTDIPETGHVYGLAVGGFLGSTIEIEAIAVKTAKGKGSLRFNDTAGSMAKDSVFNAAAVISSLTGKDIRDYHIHVNVIGGGKIDGPSAGAAVTMALLSAAENIPLRQDIAVTGEISLRGRIKPVGGIAEKIYGAGRRGIKKVIIPWNNRNDIPADLRGTEVIPVKTIEEIRDLLCEVKE